MSSPNLSQTTATATAIDEELVAYLDGELAAEEAARIERRLAEDPLYRARLAQLQRAWDLLDTLQRAEADDELVHSTVAMVAIQAEQDARTQKLRIVRRRTLGWLGLAAAVLLAAGGTYYLVYQRLAQPYQQLVRDLPVIERVDEYRNIDNVDFLKELARENLFAGEVDDGM